MKLKERLAAEWVRSQMGKGEEGILVNPGNSWVEEAAIKAFKAGFDAGVMLTVGADPASELYNTLIELENDND